MKKYIFTESQLKTIIDSQLNEQTIPNKDCFFMAFDNYNTTFDNGTIQNNTLSFKGENHSYECSDVLNKNVMGVGSIDIIKKHGVPTVIMYTNGKPIQIKFGPNCSCKSK